MHSLEIWVNHGEANFITFVNWAVHESVGHHTHVLAYTLVYRKHILVLAQAELSAQCDLNTFNLAHTLRIHAQSV